jgi:hypothetical protein
LDIWNIELLHFISWQWVQETIPAKVNTAFGKRQTEVDQKWVQETTLPAKKVNTAFGKRQTEIWVQDRIG